MFNRLFMLYFSNRMGAIVRSKNVQSRKTESSYKDIHSSPIINKALLELQDAENYKNKDFSVEGLNSLCTSDEQLESAVLPKFRRLVQK